MADISITAANVVAASGAGITSVTAGETITAGQAVYKDTSDSNEYKLCDAGAAGTADCDGVALNNASDGQPLSIWTSGALNPGATVVAGTVYVVSETAGGIAPIGDLLSGDYVSLIGIADTTSQIQALFKNTGVAIA